MILRFLRAAILGMIGRRRGIFDVSVLHFRAWPTDIDFNMHLNDGRYMTIMGVGRGHLLSRTGVLREALRRKWAPVVGGVIIRYKREVRPFAKFTLRSRIVGWDAKWVYLEHTIESGGKTSAVAYVRGVLRSREGAVPTSEMLALIGSREASPPLPDVVRNWPEIEV